MATTLPSTAAELGWLFLDAITPPRGRALWAPSYELGTQRAQPLKGESGCGRASPSRDCFSPTGLRPLRSVCGMTAFRFGAWCGTPRSLGVPHPTPPPQPCHTLRSAVIALLALLRCADYSRFAPRFATVLSRSNAPRRASVLRIYAPRFATVLRISAPRGATVLIPPLASLRRARSQSLPVCDLAAASWLLTAANIAAELGWLLLDAACRTACSVGTAPIVAGFTVGVAFNP